MWKRKRQEQRRPVSVTRIGPFTVSIYDMEAYRQSILKYYGDPDARSPAPSARPARPLPKKMSRYDWAGVQKTKKDA